MLCEYCLDIAYGLYAATKFWTLSCTFQSWPLQILLGYLNTSFLERSGKTLLDANCDRRDELQSPAGATTLICLNAAQARGRPVPSIVAWDSAFGRLISYR
jgi:hypothetical protein